MKKKTKSKSKVSKKKSKKSRNVDSSVLDHVDKLNAVIRETIRVPCNTALANHPFIEVEKTTVLRGDENYSVSMVGMINGLLSSMNLPPVGVVWQKLNQNDPDSTSVIVGFAALPSDLQAESETDK